MSVWVCWCHWGLNIKTSFCQYRDFYYKDKTSCSLYANPHAWKDCILRRGQLRICFPFRIQWWGLLIQFPTFCNFPNVSESPEHALAIEYHVYIWQMSPKLSYGDTCQIWMWLKVYNRYFFKIENFAYGEISERSFSNPHTRLARPTLYDWLCGLLNIKMQCSQYCEPHYVNKAILLASYRQYIISYTGKTTSLYWMRPWDGLRAKWSCSILIYSTATSFHDSDFVVLCGVGSGRSEMKKWHYVNSRVSVSKWIGTPSKIWLCGFNCVYLIAM